MIRERWSLVIFLMMRQIQTGREVEEKNVRDGLRAETDTDQVVECVAGKEQINKHSSAVEASQSQSLK